MRFRINGSRPHAPQYSAAGGGALFALILRFVAQQDRA
jgi:hypothetical protein